MSRSNLEYMELSMLTIWMGSQAAQMLVKVTTSLKRMVHTSNSPVGERHSVYWCQLHLQYTSLYNILFVEEVTA